MRGLKQRRMPTSLAEGDAFHEDVRPAAHACGGRGQWSPLTHPRCCTYGISCISCISRRRGEVCNDNNAYSRAVTHPGFLGLNLVRSVWGAGWRVHSVRRTIESGAGKRGRGRRWFTRALVHIEAENLLERRRGRHAAVWYIIIIIQSVTPSNFELECALLLHRVVAFAVQS